MTPTCLIKLISQSSCFPMMYIDNDLDKYDTQVLTTGYFKLIHHCTFKSFLVVRLGVSRVYRVVYAREHIFFKINGVGKLQKFSSELELACPSTKISPWTICNIQYFHTTKLYNLQNLKWKTVDATKCTRWLQYSTCRCIGNIYMHSESVTWMHACLNKQIICDCSCVVNLFLYTCRYVYQHMFYNCYGYIRHLTKVILKVIELKGEPTGYW